MGAEGELCLMGSRPTLWHGRLYNAGPLTRRRLHVGGKPCHLRLIGFHFLLPLLSASLTSAAEYQAADRMMQSGWLEGKKKKLEAMNE